MRIEIQEHTNRATIESESITSTEVLRDFMGLMVAVGFHQKSIDNSILEIAEEIEFEQEEINKETEESKE